MCPRLSSTWPSGLACPVCRHPLPDHAGAGVIECTACTRRWPQHGAFPELLPDWLVAADWPARQAETTRYEGPADFAAVLGVHLQSLGWETVELSAIQPYYFPRMPNPSVTISLVKLLDHAYGIETPVEASIEFQMRPQHFCFNPKGNLVEQKLIDEKIIVE